MGVSVRVVAHAPGRATITALAMPLAGPDSHAGHKDILSYPALKDTFTIEVIPKLGTSCDQPLLIPPHGSVQLFNSYRPNQEVKYSLMHPSGAGCNDIVRSVGKDGQLKVGGSLGHCHVHVAASSSNQAITRHVIVDRVALLVTGPHHEGDTVLDVRQRVEYYVTPKNALGSEFSDTERVQLDFEVQPSGIVKVRLDNLTLQVTAERSGKAVVRIFLIEDPKVQEFFEIHVREIAPTQTSTSYTTTQLRSPQTQEYSAKVYADKPVSHHVPFEPVWYRVEFLHNKDNTDFTKHVNYQCSIVETQWAKAKAHSTSAANYCIVNPTVPSSPHDVVANLTLVIDSDELHLHHEQSIPQAPIFTVIGPLDRKFTSSLTPQSIMLFSSTPHVKVAPSNSLRVKPTSQRQMGSGYVTDYLVEFANTPASGTPVNVDDDYYIHFYEDGKGSDVRMTFSVEEGTNYLFVALCSVLVIVLSLILCGIPSRTFPRAHTSRTLPDPIPPSTPQPKVSTPIHPSTQQNAPLDLPTFIPSIYPVTPLPPYPTSTSKQSPYGAASYSLSPQSPTPVAASPPRFLVNTNQSFYESQKLRGPKF